MSRFFLSRALLVLLLAFAVPIQGLAALSAGICMALGHHGGEALEHDHGTTGDSLVPGPGASAAHPHGDHPSSGEEAKGSHCAPCVSCCAAAAIAPFPPAKLGEGAVGPPAPALLFSFSGVAPQRLDRPPLAL